jgi:hypothetical protein
MAQLFTLLFILMTTQYVNALGNRPPRPVDPEPFSMGFAKPAQLQGSSIVNFDTSFAMDLNKDGVLDQVSCSNVDLSVTVKDGKDLNKNLFRWEIPWKTHENGSKRSFTGCEVVELTKGSPSIVASTVFNSPTIGARIVAPQFVFLNVNGRLKAQQIAVHSGASEFIYSAAARSVKCIEYPESLVRLGYKAGALCFFAGYDTGNSGSKITHTALLKLETVNDVVIAKDLTASAGLLWSGGARGTAASRFPTYVNNRGDRKIDGLHMMDGAFLDPNKDGLPDLVTVGQHASIRASTMKFNRSRPEGIEFSTTNILTAKNGNMTEFLRVRSFREHDKGISKPCVYVSGERYDSNYSSPSRVYDHIRCFESGKWVRYNLPGHEFSSEYSNAIIKRCKNNRIYLRAPKIELINGVLQRSGFNFFEVVH